MIIELTSISECIDAFGGPTAFARLIQKAPSTASEMKRRGSIPLEYWPIIIDSQEGQRIGITSDGLMRLHLSKKASAA
jgi:hypothetical protein